MERGRGENESYIVWGERWEARLERSGERVGLMEELRVGERGASGSVDEERGGVQGGSGGSGVEERETILSDRERV